MIDLARRVLTQLVVLSGHPLAFLVISAFVVAWLVFEPEIFDWHGIATIVVWIMTLFIQRAEHATPNRYKPNWTSCCPRIRLRAMP